ncbi:MAG: DUF1653 domain-containing protein [Patescibacteria group bacterium]
MNQNDHIKSGVYRHYKGKEYDVYGAAIQSGTEDSEQPVWSVIYRPRWGQRRLTYRLEQEFLELVNVNGTLVPRFIFVRCFDEDEADAKIVSSLLSV